MNIGVGRRNNPHMPQSFFTGAALGSRSAQHPGTYQILAVSLWGGAWAADVTGATWEDVLGAMTVAQWQQHSFLLNVPLLLNPSLPSWG